MIPLQLAVPGLAAFAVTFALTPLVKPPGTEAGLGRST